jgi:DNA invertase Pin-like site-specific DNA recombinase
MELPKRTLSYPSHSHELRRADLAKALAFIKPRDCLVVRKLDRLGRSLLHLLTTVADRKSAVSPFIR